MTAHGDFITRIRAAVRAVEPSLNPFQVDMVTAFFAHETGFGSQGPYAKFGHYNLGNITRSVTDSRPVDFEASGDYTLGPSGQHISVDQRWAVFTSDEDGVRGWFEFLKAPRYAQALSQLMAGESGFVSTLGKAGYYGETVDHYLHGVPGHSWDSGFIGALAEVEAFPAFASPVPVADSGQSGNAGLFAALGVGLLAIGAVLLYFILT